jgi:hypothetical protein
MTHEISDPDLQEAMRYLVLNVPSRIREGADALLKRADGDTQRALECAFEREDEAADCDYLCALMVRELCQWRAQADFEGSYVLIEVIENQSA